MKSTP
jgi:signal transduction histidine kinase